jgi:hypothetical protein
MMATYKRYGECWGMAAARAVALSIAGSVRVINMQARGYIDVEGR